MSDSDYKKGQQGLAWSPDMNRTDYEAGKWVYDDKQRILGAGSGPKTPISGAGLGLVMMAPILAFMYPVASAIAVAAVLGAAQLVDFIPENHPFMRIGFVVAVGIAALFPAGKAEHKVSEFKVYRISRHVFRLIAAFGLAVGAMIGDLRDKSFDAVLNNAPPATPLRRTGRGGADGVARSQVRPGVLPGDGRQSQGGGQGIRRTLRGGGLCSQEPEVVREALVYRNLDRLNRGRDAADPACVGVRDRAGLL